MFEQRSEWMQRAACKGMEPSLFVASYKPNKKGGHEANTSQQRIRDAKKVCYGCPVMQVCLETALTDKAGCKGVWGSTTDGERERIRKARAKEENDGRCA